MVCLVSKFVKREEFFRSFAEELGSHSSVRILRASVYLCVFGIFMWRCLYNNNQLKVFYEQWSFFFQIVEFARVPIIQLSFNNIEVVLESKQN